MSRLDGSIGALLTAVENLAPQPMPADEEPWLRFNLALRFWTFGLRQDMRRLLELLADAEVSAFPTSASVEEALRHVGAASDKLVAIHVLALGIPALVVEEGRVQFRPKDSPANDEYHATMRELSQTNTTASRLTTMAAELADGRLYRDELSRSLAAVSTTYLAPIRAIELDADLKLLYAADYYIQLDGVQVASSVGPDDVYERALAVARGDCETLLDAIELTSAFVADQGRFRKPPLVFFVNGGGERLPYLDDPRYPDDPGHKNRSDR